MANLSWISSNPDYINQMIRNTQVTLSNNYNDLDNIPIIKITSTTNNPQKIWELKEGLYMIDGVAQVDNNTSYEVSNLLISMTARLENGKYILSAFIPYLRGLFEYILKTNSTEYEQHQKIVLMIKNDTLALDNETIYTPIEDYHPATKKYVDDKTNEIVTELDRMGVNKENLESLNKENRIRDIKLQALLSETSDRNITIEENVRYFDMPLSIDNGIVTINEIVGETLVNVCDQEESVAITKSYTVENENHIALQGEYDGSCRPVVHGNTLVNHNADWDGKVQTGIETSASGIEDVQVEGIKGQEVSVVVEGNTVLNHALGKTSAVVSNIESNLFNGNTYHGSISSLPVKPLTTYTVIATCLLNEATSENIGQFNYCFFSNETTHYNHESLAYYSGVQVGEQVITTIVTDENCKYIGVYDTNSNFIMRDILILEGNHITNPKYVNPNDGNYVDLTVANDMSSVVEIEGRTMVNLVNHKLYEAQHLRAVSYDEVNKEYSMTIDNYTFPAFAIKLNYSTTLNKTYFISFKMKATATKNFKYNITHFDVYSAWNVGGEEYTLTENYQTFTKTFTSTADEYLGLGFSFLRNDNNEFSDIVINIKDIMIFEGDLTQTPHLIPSGYFEGLKSSYEYEVTEDGKYKVDVKVTGKNLCDKTKLIYGGYIAGGGTYGGRTFVEISDKHAYIIIPVKPNTQYRIYCPNVEAYVRQMMTREIESAHITGYYYTHTFRTFSYTNYLAINIRIDGNTILTKDYINNVNIQLEEGTEATSYEPYFESTKTFYLNSPLLEGDKIVTKNGKVYHYHKMGKVVLDGSKDWDMSNNLDKTCRFSIRLPIDSKGTMDTTDSIRGYSVSNNFLCDHDTTYDRDKECYQIGWSIIGSIYIRIFKSKLSTLDVDGFKQWLSKNPTTVVYELASPYYELIDEYNNTILNIPKNVAHLTHTSAVPVNNTTFTNYKDELNVLEPNTQYRLMFDCDKANIPFTVTLGGTSQTVTSKIGTHSLLITTPNELVDKNLVIDGIGRCGIDNIRIFKGDVEYDYVKGLWSGYEERKLENLCPAVVSGYEAAVSPTQTRIVPRFDKTLDNVCNEASHCIIIKNEYISREFTVVSNGDLMIESLSYINNQPKWIKVLTYHSYGCAKIQLTPLETLISFGTREGYTVDNITDLKILVLEGDWTDNPPTYEEVMANEGKYAVKVKLDNPNATIFGKGGRL